MPEYAYSRKHRIWYDIGRNPFIFSFGTGEIIGIDKTKLLSEEKINDLRNARRNKKFLIFDNTPHKVPIDKTSYYIHRGRYPGIPSDYIYEDISDIKLIICNGERFLSMYSSLGCHSTGRYLRKSAINYQIFTPEMQDFSVVVDYIENNAEADTRIPEMHAKSKEERHAYFLERLKLYYDDLDNDAKLVYNILGHYSID